MAGTPDPSVAAGVAWLGDALAARVDDAVAAMFEQTQATDGLLDRVIEEDFCEVGRISTRAVAQWMASGDAGAAREVGLGASLIFAQLASKHNAPLNEVEALPALA